ncbi:transglutaminaseTgpA domain-containing protein [Gracilibacillus xinjiangensis]|uniref:TransglutaminaseTgpA domain-containing protein n=1 Tax=Gracilibacillus xinjiangensis TaxID=1193282 RepID=A0ABV8WUF5_9BACI
MNVTNKNFSFPSLLILAAGFLLFWEWLRPLKQITDTGSLHLFIIYTGYCFLLSFFVKNGSLKFILKAIGLVFVLDYLFLTSMFFSSEWIEQLVTEISYNIQVIMQADWNQMTPFVRSFLFLILLWLMSYLLHFWFLIANKFFLFVVLTIFYLAILDTFTDYAATTAIIRTVFIAFIALGLSRYMHLQETNVSVERNKNFFRWMIPVSIIVLVAVGLGLFAPKPNPQWPDPVPFIQSTAGHVGFGEGNSIQRVGYGENDSNLGGSFIKDDTPVFEAYSKEKLYWRIESKDIYTGKGWERSTELNYVPLRTSSFRFQTFSLSQVETTPSETSLRYASESNLSKVPFPYGSSFIMAPNGANLFQDRESGMMEVEAAEQNMANESFTILYEAPSFNIDQLNQVSEKDPADIRNQYLQLPDTLPQRVKDLAEEIVDQEQTRYEKAKAIENYFGQNGYTYQIEDVSIPQQGEDYVDQFLFETRVGYCDNFSTSMVVLLRSLDIPARWVKGFTGGELKQVQPDLANGYHLYEITNNNAHSWVEVYFPEIGWVPFEPTSGFTNPTNFYQETAGEMLTPEESGEDAEPQEESEEQQQEEMEQDVTEQEENSDTLAGNDTNSNNNRVWFIIVVILLTIPGIIAFVKRYEIRDWYDKRKWANISKQMELDKGYLYVMSVLDKRGYHRQKGQTLRQYARSVDEQMGINEMMELTLIYEQYLYRKSDDKVDRNKLRELFQKVIDQIFA